MSDKPMISIRDCETLQEFRRCVDLQQEIWGWEDRDLIPARMFVVAHKIEGQVLGAFEPSGKMIGFLLAIPAVRGGTSYLHSHMLGVLPEYREAGLGRRMKLEQRKRALAAGFKLIEWTFDPLEFKNAYFNIVRLGAIARRYVVNQYGESSSPLHRALPTDRLIAEWWIESPHAIAWIEGNTPPPQDVSETITAETNVQSPQETQLRLRAQFQAAFSKGLVVIGFKRDADTASYLLGNMPSIH